MSIVVVQPEVAAAQGDLAFPPSGPIIEPVNFIVTRGGRRPLPARGKGSAWVVG